MPSPSDSTPAPPSVSIYTDGACSGNPGPGGWAAVLVANGREKEISGAEPLTTNNRMELLAAAEALEALNAPCTVALHSDSAYLVNAFNDRWIAGWQKRGWTKADKSPVLNRDLWERLVAQNARHTVRWVKVKGHAGVPMNERVDGLAVAAMRRMMAG
ncbi:MAG TPA: ribonuclease HI [Rubricoccaceae bacterium]